MANNARIDYIPIDQRDPASVRAVILARSSDPGAKAEDMRGQIEKVKNFVEQMGWTLSFDAYTFAESRSGMRNVTRPVLDEVLKLAIQGAVDVIVCSEMERVARNKMRRYQAIQTALDYGVEFRFVQFAKDRGKLPDDSGTRMYLNFLEEYGAAEAEKIADRLMPAKMLRFEEGLPHGRLYGYAPGERRKGKHGKPMGLLTWVINEGEAKHVRWMFDQVDVQPPAEVSLRRMARELDLKGVATPRGSPAWSASQVRSILRNPKYCGRGKNLRYGSDWGKKRDPETNIVRDVQSKFDRMNDQERWESETYPVLPTAIPPIVEPDQWERVQAKLKEAAALNNRGGPRRTDAEANSTLLDNGYVRCAECRGRMTRHWEKKSNHPYYRCYKQGDRPSHPHVGFHVPAHSVDVLAVRLLAKALTDPEKILELASAAEGQLIEANTDAELALSALAAYHQRLTDITAEQDKLRAAKASLRGTTGMEEVVAGIQARLAQLDQEREQAENDRERATPQRDYAQARAEFLRSMFTVQRYHVNFLGGESKPIGSPQLSIGLPGVRRGADGTAENYRNLTLPQAAELLGVPVDSIEALGIPIRRGRPYWDDETEREEVDIDLVEVEDVVYCLLARMPRERLRKLLHDLDAVVKVERGRTRAEIDAGVKKPALAERVYLELLGTVRVRTDVKNVKISSYGCLCSFGPPPGGRSIQMKETLLSPCR